MASGRRNPAATTASPKAAPVLELRSLGKRYGDVHAVDDISLEICPGEVVGVLGTNGAGKTTLLSMAVGLTTPDSGSVVVDGIDVTRIDPPRRPRIGFAPQDIGLYLPLTVRQNLAFFAAVEGIRGVEADDRIQYLFDLLELDALADRPTRLLSGGEARRAHLACALVTMPRLVLFDEPTVGLDVAGRARFLELVRSLATNGAAVCFSSHYLTEVEALCDRVVVIEGGRVIAEGTVAALVDRHARPSVDIELLDGTHQIVECPGGETGLPAVLSSRRRDLVKMRSITLVRPTLESVFLALTGRRLDDDDR